MAVINAKQLRISEPQSVRSMLEKTLKNGHGHIVSKYYDPEDNGGTFYYLLPGFLIRNLSEVNLTDEAAGKLDNGLVSGNINYVMYPGDRTHGQIPLVLDRDTRFYLESQVGELFKTGSKKKKEHQVQWYIFKVPVDVDPDDNERVSSKLFMDAEGQDPVTVDYDEIESFLRAHGDVKHNLDNDAFDDEVEREDREEEEQKKEQKKEKKDNMDIQQQIDKDEIDSRIEDIEQDVDEDEKDVDAKEDTSTSDEKANDDDTSSEADTDDDEDVGTLGDMFDDDFDDEIDDLSFFDSPQPQHLGDDKEKDADEDNESKDDNQKDMTDESFDNYTKHTDKLNRMLERIQLPRFEYYENDHLSEQARTQMNRYVDDTNQRIASIEDQIKEKATSDYESRMTGSYGAIKKSLDPESGNELIQQRYKRLKDDIENAHQEASQKIADNDKALKEDFEGPQFERYKKEILANLFDRFKEEYYGSRVSIPSDEYKEQQESIVDDKEQELKQEYNSWRMDLESTAITADQESAVNSIGHGINKDIDAAMDQLKSLRSDLERERNTLMSQEIAQQSAKQFEDRLKDESIAAIKKEFREQYGVALSEQSAHLDELKAQLKEEREKHEREIEDARHNQQRDEERLKRERQDFEVDKKQLDEERERVRNQQHSLINTEVPEPKEAPSSNESSDDATSNTKQATSRQGNPNKLATGLTIGGLSVLAVGGVGFGAYELGHYGFGGHNTEHVQQHSSEQAKSDKSSDDTPYLDHAKVTVPDKDYQKGDTLKYDGEDYKVKDTTKTTVKVTDPDGKQFKIPLRD